jgi:transposase
MSTGRPSKLTPEVQARIIEALRAGNYQDTAAAYAGVSRTAFYRWMEQGAQPDAAQPYKDFRDAVEKARAESEVRNVALIQRAASDGTWQAAAWFLERSFQQRWGRKQELSGPGGGPIQVEQLTPDEAKQRLAQVRGEIETRLRTD